jgi:hypothetical protein
MDLAYYLLLFDVNGASFDSDTSEFPFQQKKASINLGVVDPCIFTHSMTIGKPEAAAAVDRLLMMGIRMPEIC